MWPDAFNGYQVIASKRSMQWIPDAATELLRSWQQHGFVVVREAIDSETIDQLKADIAEVWAGTLPHPAIVEKWERETKTVQPACLCFRDRPVKLLDLFAASTVWRRVMFAPLTNRVLLLLLKGPCFAFQSIHFGWTSRREVHQDSALVRVVSPREFPASWVALEEIRPHSGELEYTSGTQRVADCLFSGTTNWIPFRSPEDDIDIASLKTHCAAPDLDPRRFLPRRRDVLLWYADSAHGGSSHTSSGATRKSFVTDDCPGHGRRFAGWGICRSARHRFKELGYCSFAIRG